MVTTKFLAEVHRELLGSVGGDLRGRRFFFDGVLSTDNSSKTMTFWGSIDSFVHRKVEVQRGRGNEESEYFEIICADGQTRIVKSSTNSKWTLRFGGEPFLGTVTLE